MVVINTSPAIHLNCALPGGVVDLPELIGDVVIPWEVGQELAVGHDKDSTWTDIQNVPGLFLRDLPLAIHPLILSQIDLGEAAVIQTALDNGHDTVVLDDLKARRVAITLGLKVTGTLGILIQAKRAGRLPSISSAITKLECRGMWLAPEIVRKAIQLAGE